MLNLTAESQNLPSASDSPQPPMQEKEPHQRHRTILLALLLLFVILCAGYWLFLRTSSNLAGNRAGTAASPKSPTVPVEIAEARTGDLPVYLDALGTVTPVSTVSTFSRIQGEIMKVNYREGQFVKKGDSLIEIDPRPFQATLLQAQGQLRRDEALLRQARIDLKRYRLAFKTRSIPKQQLDDQEQIVYQYEGAVVADQGVLQSAQVNLEYCHINSPINGRIGLRLIDPGNLVQANSTTALAVITQLQPITVIFNVPQDSLPAIQQQLERSVSMKVEALDRARQKLLATGTFLAMDNQVDVTTGTVRIRALFENPDNALFPNQFVNARLQINVLHDATLIPTQAVQSGPQGSFVYVIRPDQTAQVRAIKQAVTEGSLTAVIEGIKPGERIAIRGFDKLREGAKVSLATSPTPQARAGQAQQGNL